MHLIAAAHHHHGISAPTVANVIAGVALFLALANIALSLALPWLRNRKAHLEVRHESYPTTTSGREPKPGHAYRLVVVNHGPARAHEVHLNLGTIDTDNGQPLTAERVAAEFKLFRIMWPESIPTLHQGQSFHLHVIRAAAMPALSYVDVDWEDGRGKQQQRIWLSLQTLH